MIQRFLHLYFWGQEIPSDGLRDPPFPPEGPHHFSLGDQEGCSMEEQRSLPGTPETYCCLPSQRSLLLLSIPPCDYLKAQALGLKTTELAIYVCQLSNS